MSSSRNAAASRPQIGALLRLAHENVQATVFARTAAGGFGDLRPAHFRLFRFPGIDGIRPVELARRMETSKQALNALLNDLESWGYVERRNDATDGRGVVLHLTERGRRLMDTIRRTHTEIEEEWLATLGRGPFNTLRKALVDIVGDDQL